MLVFDIDNLFFSFGSSVKDVDIKHNHFECTLMKFDEIVLLEDLLFQISTNNRKHKGRGCEHL